jgi:maleylpyruvate isomerase
MVNSGIQPLQNLSLLLSLSEFGVDKVSWAQKQIEKGLLALEKVACQVAQTSPGLYLVGESPSVADLCLIPQLYNARRFKVDLQLFPRLCEVEANCQRLEAFQRALPEVQADAQ